MFPLRPRNSKWIESLRPHTRSRCFATNAKLRLDTNGINGHVNGHSNGISKINGINGVNGQIDHLNGVNSHSDDWNSASNYIRQSSLFPHRVTESAIHSILDRVQYIDSVDGASMIDKVIADVDEQRPRDAAAFNVVDLGAIVRQHLRWTSLLPTVHPFYAVKCNPDPVIVSLLNALGASFDCASKSEFDLLKRNGVSLDTTPEKVVFSHPCKHPLHFEYAREIGVNLCTFDNEYEIEKIANHHPNCKALLRIQVDDSQSKMKFNSKYGLNVENKQEVHRIFELCKQHNIDLKGIMFHVGSGCMDSAVYGTAIEQSKYLFDVAQNSFDFDPQRMDTLDLGGGFPGLEETGVSSFEEMAGQINHSLHAHFGNENGYKFIAEPGRYYVAKSTSLVCEVIAKKRREDKGFMYYLNDGIFGAFNCIHWENVQPVLLPHKVDKVAVNGQSEKHLSTIFGPTCDSLDVMYHDYPLREMDILDKVVVPDFGAYTCCLATGFNGFECPKSHYVLTI